MKPLVLLTSLLGLVLLGCSSEEEYAPAVVPKQHVFEGQVDEQYAGTWKSQDGTSTIDLEKDGVLEIETVTKSQGGENKSKVDGKWLVSGSNLLLEYLDSNGTTVLKYQAKLSGDTLSLTQDGSKVETEYRKQ